MGADGWSAIAAGFSAGAAVVSLMVAWNARAIQGRSADFANCIDVTSRLADAQRRVREAQDDEARYKFEFRELLNLLEALALLHNDNKIAPSTKKFTCKFLEEAIGWIRVNPEMAAFMRQSTTSDETYHEIQKFEGRRKPNIRTLSRSYVDRRDLSS